MKSVTISLYKFNELDKEVRQKIVNKERWNNLNRVMESANEEREDSLKEFCDIFCVDLKRYECGYNGSYFNFKIDEDKVRDINGTYSFTPDEVSGKYLRRFLNNENVWKYIIRGSYHGMFTKDDKLIQRYSKVVFHRCCVLTGTCYDDDLMSFVWEVYDKPIKDNFTLHDLVSMCLSRFFDSWFKEYQFWGDTDSAIEEALENYYENDYFYADGTRFVGIINSEVA